MGGTGDDDLVIRAGDRHRDVLAGGVALVVAHRDGEGFGEGFAHTKRLNRLVRVVEGVGPALAAAGATDGAGDGSQLEAAVCRRAAEVSGMDVGDIQIREGHRALGDQGAVFCHSTRLGGTGDDDLVIRAGDRDGDDLSVGISRSRVVHNLDRISKH